MTDFLNRDMHHKDVEICGDYDARFEPVVRVLRKQVARYGGGASASVFLEGESVVDIWAGQARNDGTPWERNTMALCFSASKGVAATAIHILATDGLLEYDAPVARYWPEFGQKGKEVITVRQVLAHQAGLHKTAPLVDDLTDILDWDKVISRLETTEPDFHPGTANGYHAMTFGWLVGELVHRISGMSFTDFVQKRIVEPLDLDGMLIGNADAELDRVADLVGVPA
ncbi:MAG: beta-lactamase family protein, partial [Deltaproteobacteria bacterium]|nr:beta-lactamase family protein [Deltaproteobacteria bacterium]